MRLSVTQSYVLDAWALIALIQHEEPAASRVLDLLSGGEGGQVSLLVPVINLGEVYYRLGRAHGEAAADVAMNLISRTEVRVVPAEHQTVMAAARLKMRYPISYADAFAAATAVAHRAVLVTGDRDFAAVEDRVQIEWLARG